MTELTLLKSEDEEAMSLLVHEPQYVLSELFDMSSIASTQSQ